MKTENGSVANTAVLVCIYADKILTLQRFLRKVGEEESPSR